MQKGGGPGGTPSSGRRVRKRSLVLVVVGVVAVLTLVWWMNRGQAGAGARAEKGRRAFFGAGAEIPVVAQKVQTGDIAIYLDGLGTVTPLASAIVRPVISGQLMEVHFSDGQEVKAGELLAIIDPRPYENALEQAQGQLLQAQAQLRQARLDYARYQTLAKQDSIAQQQVDSQLTLVTQEEGQVKTDQAAIDNAKLNLIYCHITAPFAGRVGLRQVDPGNFVTPGDANGIVTLTKMRPISVVFTLPEDEYPKVVARQRAGAKILTEAFDGAEMQKLASGTLTAIDNQADTSTGTFKLRATFANEDELLFPNEFVNVHMLLDMQHDALVIPTSAIEEGQLGTYVYVVEPGNTVSARPVTLGATQGERVAVIKGLAVGESVVIDGADRLKDGSPVTVQTAGETGSGWVAPEGAPRKGGWHHGAGPDHPGAKSRRSERPS